MSIEHSELPPLSFASAARRRYNSTEAGQFLHSLPSQHHNLLLSFHVRAMSKTASIVQALVILASMTSLSKPLQTKSSSHFSASYYFTINLPLSSHPLIHHSHCLPHQDTIESLCDHTQYHAHHSQGGGILYPPSFVAIVGLHVLFSSSHL